MLRSSSGADNTPSTTRPAYLDATGHATAWLALTRSRMADDRV